MELDNDHHENDGKLEKAAAVMIALESTMPGVTKEIFLAIGEDKSKNLIKTIARMGQVSTELTENSLKEFHNLAVAKQSMFGGMGLSEDILKNSFGMSSKDYFIQRSDRFKFLNNLSPELIYLYFKKESDQVRLFIFSYLNQKSAAYILSKMDDTFNSKIITQVEIPNFKLMDTFENKLEDHFEILNVSDHMEDSGQATKLASILELMNSTRRTEIVNTILKRDAKMGTAIQNLIFNFEDFNTLPDATLQTILFEIADYRAMAIALQKCSPELKEKIDRCLVDRTKEIVNAEIKGVTGRVNDDEIEDAHRTIINVARELEKKGGVKIHGN